MAAPPSEEAKTDGGMKTLNQVEAEVRQFKESMNSMGSRVGGSAFAAELTRRAGTATLPADSDRWMRNPAMDGEKLGKASIGFLRYHDSDKVWLTVEGLQVKFSEHIMLSCIREIKSSGQTFGNSRLVFQNESPHSTVAVIEKAEVQQCKWHAQGWRHEGCGSRRRVRGSRAWAPWRMASSWAGTQRTQHGLEVVGTLPAEVGHVTVVSPIKWM